MHILWISDSPTTPSGFGNVTRFVCSGLASHGFRVSILGWQSHGQPETWRDCRVYPVKRDPFGADILLSYLQRLRPDVVIALADVWWLTFITHPLVRNYMQIANMRWALYYPIDGDTPAGRLPDSWVQMLKQVDIPIAMSRYGQEVTQRCGLHCFYIPHGVDTKIFRPSSDKFASKAALGYEGRFVVLSDARNQPRKMLPRLLEIFQRFAQDKDDVLLHLHCDPADDSACSPLYTYNIRADLEQLRLGEKVRFTSEFKMRANGGLPLEQLAAIYAASDVHLLVSTGEGFGLPSLQAASAGVVPMAADYSANHELVDVHGEALPVKYFVRNEFGLRRALVDIEATAQRLEGLYYDRQKLEQKAQAAICFAKDYDWDRVIPQWVDLLLRECAPSRPFQRLATTSVQFAYGRANGPPDLTGVLQTAVRGIPANTQVTLKVSQAQAGIIERAIQSEVFLHGHELSLPVTLPPAFKGAPNRVPGRVCLGPGDIERFIALKRIFPGMIGLVFVTEPGMSTPTQSSGLSIIENPLSKQGAAQLVASSSLVLDQAGSLPGCLALDRLAAALDTPYLGESAYWEAVTPNAHTNDVNLEQPRCLLLDQGLAEGLCLRARQRLIEIEGPQALEAAWELARLRSRRSLQTANAR